MNQTPSMALTLSHAGQIWEPRTLTVPLVPILARQPTPLPVIPPPPATPSGIVSGDPGDLPPTAASGDQCQQVF